MIILDGVCKSYKGTRVLSDIELRLNDGIVYGLRGVNGSGKTTLLQIISGLVIPTSGLVIVDGKQVNPGSNIPDSIGALIDSPGFIARYSGLKNLMFLSGLGLPFSKDDACLMMGRCGLDSSNTKPYKKYSLGMKQRLGIGMALVGEPDLLVLDEPINGLDPQGIAEVRDTIQRLRDERNMTILISSHILEELSKIATDYGIIHNGSLLQELTSEELMKRCSERIEIELIHPEQAVPILDRMGFTNYQVTDESHIHIFERLNESANVNMELAKAGILVNGISITSEELETYFLNLTGGNQNA